MSYSIVDLQRTLGRKYLLLVREKRRRPQRTFGRKYPLLVREKRGRQTLVYAYMGLCTSKVLLPDCSRGRSGQGQINGVHVLSVFDSASDSFRLTNSFACLAAYC